MTLVVLEGRVSLVTAPRYPIELDHEPRAGDCLLFDGNYYRLIARLHDVKTGALLLLAAPTTDLTVDPTFGTVSFGTVSVDKADV